MTPVIELAGWWPVARGAGASMRPWREGERPATLPAHVGLWLDRMLAEPHLYKGQEWRGRRELYDTAVEALAPSSTRAADPPAVASYRPVFDAWRKAVGASEPGIVRRVFALEALDRILLHSASNATVTEGSVLLHHTYGVPYLPGSALKGAVRTRLDRQSAGTDEEASRLRALAAEILGCLASERPAPEVAADGPKEDEPSGLASLVDFYDALWIPPEIPPRNRERWSPLAVDIVNPHHPTFNTSQAGGRSLPRDTDEPVPVHRLSLAPGACFLAVVEARDFPGVGAWLDWLRDEILSKALAEDGIGAWTTADYGRLKMQTPTGAAKREVSPAAEEWHRVRLIYEAGSGSLSAALPDGRRAEAGREQTRKLLAGLPEKLQEALTKSKKREAPAEVQVGPEGIRWRLVAVRPASSA
jgi:CRISPR-associated protein Cmr6